MFSVAASVSSHHTSQFAPFHHHLRRQRPPTRRLLRVSSRASPHATLLPVYMGTRQANSPSACLHADSSSDQCRTAIPASQFDKDSSEDRHSSKPSFSEEKSPSSPLASDAVMSSADRAGSTSAQPQKEGSSRTQRRSAASRNRPGTSCSACRRLKRSCNRPQVIAKNGGDANTDNRCTLCQEYGFAVCSPHDEETQVPPVLSNEDLHATMPCLHRREGRAVRKFRRQLQSDQVGPALRIRDTFYSADTWPPPYFRHAPNHGRWRYQPYLPVHPEASYYSYMPPYPTYAADSGHAISRLRPPYHPPGGAGFPPPEFPRLHLESHYDSGLGYPTGIADMQRSSMSRYSPSMSPWAFNPTGSPYPLVEGVGSSNYAGNYSPVSPSSGCAVSHSPVLPGPGHTMSPPPPPPPPPPRPALALPNADVHSDQSAQTFPPASERLPRIDRLLTQSAPSGSDKYRTTRQARSQKTTYPSSSGAPLQSSAERRSLYEACNRSCFPNARDQRSRIVLSRQLRIPWERTPDTKDHAQHPYGPI